MERGGKGALAESAGSDSASGQQPTTIAETTLVVMHGEEASRAASFGRVVAILCAVGLVLLIFDHTDPARRTAMASAQVVLGSVGAWVYWRSRDPDRYSRAVFRVFGACAAAAALVFFHYLGVFSPVPTVVILGFSFFAHTSDARWIAFIAVFVVASYAISCVVITLGLVPDLGVFAPKDVPTDQRLTMTVMVTTVMIMQLVQARTSRRATLEAIERSNAAVRVARTREAQLDEAKENLDAALRAGAGRGGRFTGASVGRFRLGEIVGRGAMGEIYATSDAAGRRLAVKLLHAAKRDDSDMVRRFLREAEIALRVRGPNLVEIIEVGATHDGFPFIVMELLEGADLATLLRDRSMLPLPEVVTLVDDVARGLAILHGANVVHRDLKPQNLFLAAGPSPVWKILDYGVSKLGDGAATLTMGQLVGTPNYMAPEQAQGRDVDHRADIFGLAAVAYRALTGRRPFTGEDTPQVLYQVVHGAPIRPRELAAGLSRDVELVLGVAFAKEPADRFASAAELARAFRAAAAGTLDARVRLFAERIARSNPWARDPNALTSSVTPARRP